MGLYQSANKLLDHRLRGRGPEFCLTDKDSNKGEKAAFMLSRLGKPALPALSKELGNREPLVRMAVLFALSRVADKTCVEVRKALDDQIALDETKPPMRPIVHEMLALRMMISH